MDRHERIVRGHVKRGTLPAAKDGNAWRIDTDDLERVPGWRVNRERLAELQARDARTSESLATRLAAVERELRDVRARLRALEAGQGRSDASPDALSGSSDRLTASGGYLDGWRATTPDLPLTAPYTPILPREGSPDVSTGDIPPGSVRLSDFCKAHGLSPSTLTRYADKGLIPAVIRRDPKRSDGYREIWLTPEHQAAALEECRRRGMVRA